MQEAILKANFAMIIGEIMKLNDIKQIVIYGTGFYKKGSKALYRRVFKGVLTEDYFIELFYELSKEHHENIKVLGPIEKAKFRVKNWKYKEVEVSWNDGNGVKIKLL